MECSLTLERTRFVEDASGDSCSGTAREEGWRALRIVIACGGFGIGGISTQALTLAAEFRTLGHYTVALVLDPFGELYEPFQTAFDQVVVMRRGLERRETFLKRIVRVVECLRPDAILGSAVPAVQAIHPYLDPSIVRITTIHSIGEEELRDGTANAASTDWVVAVAKNIANRLATQTPSNKVIVIPVGVPVSVDQHGEMPSAPLRLAYVGRLSRTAKNLGQLTAISCALDAAGVPFSLTIIGAGEEQKRLMAEFSERIQNKVMFTGPLTPLEVRRRLLDIDILLLVSTFESTPHAVLEAMAAGAVPVVSRIACATEDIVDDGVSGFLCDTNDVSQYVNVLKGLHENRKLLSQISQAARSVIGSRFACRQMAQHYIELIESAQSSRPDKFLALPSEQPIECCAELRESCFNWGGQARRRAGDLARGLLRHAWPCCRPNSDQVVQS